MKIFLGGLLCLGTAVSVWARSTVLSALPTVNHVDAEVSTNIPFSASLDASGFFSFDLSCRATPSNNVEVAFGIDTNSNGVLDSEEVDRVVGWDCGFWFTRRGVDGVYVVVSVKSTNAVQTLSWMLRVGAGGQALCLLATAEGKAMFDGLPLESVYSPSWDFLRLTGRGSGTSFKAFSVSATLDGTVFIMR